MKEIIFFCLMMGSIVAIGQQKSRANLSGKITDSVTGLPLVGASVVLVESKFGTSTDSTGNYIFRNIAEGHFLLEISFTGYRSVIEHVDLNNDLRKNFALHPTVVENEGITVTAVGSATSIRKAPIPITRVSKDYLLSLHPPILSMPSVGFPV
jgi:iron complex outermembrane receptor protein